MTRQPPRSTLFPYTPLSHSAMTAPVEMTYPAGKDAADAPEQKAADKPLDDAAARVGDRSGEADRDDRSEEHTSELQSRQYLVCRLLLEKKKHATSTASSAYY